MNYLAVSAQRVQRLERRLNICKSSMQRTCRECEDYVIDREITTVLKTAVDNAILELCGSCDFLASHADALWARHAIFLPHVRGGLRLRDEPKERLRGRLVTSLLAL